MNRRPMHNNRGNSNNRDGGGNNNRFRRNGNGGGNAGRGRAGGMDHEQEGDVVSPNQRRHAQNQQTKYQDMARNARQSGDRVEAEYYLQHVEHYTRVINLSDLQQRERDEARGVIQGRHHARDETEERIVNPAEQSETESQALTRSQHAPQRQHYNREDRAENRPNRQNEHRQHTAHSGEEHIESSGQENRQEGQEQRRRLRPFRQPRSSFVPREVENENQSVTQGQLPVQKEMEAILPPIQAEEEALPIRRGRPRKAVATDAVIHSENHGMTLAGVLPKADF